ncbi:RHS repeat-associated core domain-containing protein, partial [Leptospira sp. id769339]
YKARFFDPKIGRFIQPDSVIASAKSQGMNRYMYVSGNPVNFRDPGGHNEYVHMFNEILKKMFHHANGVMSTVGHSIDHTWKDHFRRVDHTYRRYLRRIDHAVRSPLRAMDHSLRGYARGIDHRIKSYLSSLDRGVKAHFRRVDDGAKAHFRRVDHGFKGAMASIERGFRAAARGVDQTARRIGEAFEQEVLGKRHRDYTFHWSNPFSGGFSSVVKGILGYGGNFLSGFIFDSFIELYNSDQGRIIPITDIGIAGVFILYYQWGFDENPIVRFLVELYQYKKYNTAPGTCYVGNQEFTDCD